MPQTEDEVKNEHTSDSPAKILSWWQKFHFSGRVIMCSVLFGLGLILIGGLIFAINVDDDTTKKDEKDDKSADELPTKAPSNYVGPVVMGIGGFIAIVGVIMCLFETQVCRKKSGDTKPLIPSKNDDAESKVSETSVIPSSSHCHKNHKHKSRKVSSSPRKTKSKRSNPSHEQKQTPAISKSPAIAIDKSKSFMTSSEENFLTPPNTLNEHAILDQKSSREAEIQTSSSLMKSFTSSGTWNQSTEFLTPTASYKGNSISVNNSVELDEKQDQENFSSNETSKIDYTRPEYMTPLTAEEEKIQKMLNEVKNDQKKTDKEQLKETVINLSSACGNDTSMINTENEINKNENMKDIPNKTTVVTIDALEKSKLVNEENKFSDDFSIASNVLEDEFLSNESETKVGSTNMEFYTNKDKMLNDNEKSISFQDSTKNISCSSLDSSKPHPNEISHVSNLNSDSFMENIHQIDLESNASSEETLVSLDNSIEKTKNNAQPLLPMAEKCSSIKCQKVDLESPTEKQPLFNNSFSYNKDPVTDVSKSEEVGASHLSDVENDASDSKEIINSDEKSSY